MDDRKTVRVALTGGGLLAFLLGGTLAATGAAPRAGLWAAVVGVLAVLASEALEAFDPD